MLKIFSRKIIFPTVAILLALVSFISIYLMVSMSRFSEDIAQNSARLASAGIQAYVDEFVVRSTVVAHFLSNDPELVRIIQNEERDELILFLNATKEALDIDFYILVDSESRILIRTHDLSRYDDIFPDTPTLRAALDGRPSSVFYSSPTTPLAYSSVAPVFHDDEVIAVIIANLFIGSPMFINRMSEVFDAELTFYFGGRAVASTFLDLDGEAVYADNEIIGAVFGGAESSYGQIAINGTDYFIYYFPLTNYDGTIAGMIAAAFSRAYTDAVTDDLMRGVIFIGTGAAAVAVLILLFIISGIIKPIKEDAERTSLMFNATPLTVEYWNEDGTPADCNQTALDRYGYSAKEEYFERILVDFFAWDEWNKMLAEAFENGSVKITIDEPLPDGFINYYRVEAVRTKYQGKAVVITYTQNITHLKKLQEEEQRARIAEAHDAAKSRFLAQVSHEIRTPMNAILGITEIELQRENMSDEPRNALSRIRNSSYHLLGIINNLLDLSKIDANKIEIIKSPYQLLSLIVDTAQLNMVYIGSKQIELRVIADPRLPFSLIGDELRIKQVLNNMLSNALKYTNEGEVVLSLSAVPYKKTEDTDVTLVISVKDTGKGMTEAQVRRLFSEEYLRFDEEDAVEGTGLGMAITHRLLEMMNGKIEVESAPGKGTLVTLYIPQKSTDDGTIGEEQSGRLRDFDFTREVSHDFVNIIREPMPYGRVLVVDDVELNLYVAKGHLAPYRLHVDSVMSGFEALDKISGGETYDIIFMDHMMPKMDGVETVGILRARGYEGAVVALTANALVGNHDMFMENGFDGYISKPIDIRQLNVTLNKFVRDRHPEVSARRY